MSREKENYDLEEADFESTEVIKLEINGVLDLHTFAPKDVKYLVPDYLEECRKKEILAIRIIHGKGTGSMRRTVHAILARLPQVRSFRLADGGSGGWGATVVELNRKNGL